MGEIEIELRSEGGDEGEAGDGGKGEGPRKVRSETAVGFLNRVEAPFKVSHSSTRQLSAILCSCPSLMVNIGNQPLTN